MPAMTATQALAMAAEHRRDGRAGEAEALLRRVLATRSDYPDAHLQLGLTVAAEAPARAVAHIRRTLSLVPSAAVAFAAMADILLGQGRPDLAATACRRAIAVEPGMPARYRTLADAELRNGNIDGSLDAFLLYLDACRDAPFAKEWPTHLDFTRFYVTSAHRQMVAHHVAARVAAGDRRAGMLFLLANFHFLDGSESKAQALYAAAAEADPTFQVGRLIRFDTPAFEHAGTDPLTGIAPMTLCEPYRPSGRPAVFLAVDSGYFHRYAVVLLNSLDRSGSPLDVHLHLYDADPDIIGNMPAFNARLRNLNILLSHETGDLRTLPHEARLAWYTSLRFIRLHELLERSQHPILALDADMLVRGPVTALFQAATGSDVGWMNFEEWEPYNQIIAFTLLLHPTPLARRYMGHVARYIARHLLDGTACWYTDQLALYLSMRHLQQTVGGGVRVFNFMETEETRQLYLSVMIQGSAGRLASVIDRHVPPDWKLFP